MKRKTVGKDILYVQTFYCDYCILFFPIFTLISLMKKIRKENC